jgi:hypothetical protein
MKKIVSGILSSALLLSVGTSAFAATTYYESEPNNSMSTADPISINNGDVIVRGVLDPVEVDDFDYFKVTPTATKQAELQITNLPGETIFIKIRNSSGEILDRTYKGGEILNYTFEKGRTYYIVIDGNYTEDYKPYNLSIN